MYLCVYFYIFFFVHFFLVFAIISSIFRLLCPLFHSLTPNEKAFIFFLFAVSSLKDSAFLVISLCLPGFSCSSFVRFGLINIFFIRLRLSHSIEIFISTFLFKGCSRTFCIFDISLLTGFYNRHTHFVVSYFIFSSRLIHLSPCVVLTGWMEHWLSFFCVFSTMLKEFVCQFTFLSFRRALEATDFHHYTRDFQQQWDQPKWHSFMRF